MMLLIVGISTDVSVDVAMRVVRVTLLAAVDVVVIRRWGAVAVVAAVPFPPAPNLAAHPAAHDPAGDGACVGAGGGACAGGAAGGLGAMPPFLFTAVIADVGRSASAGRAMWLIAANLRLTDQFDQFVALTYLSSQPT